MDHTGTLMLNAGGNAASIRRAHGVHLGAGGLSWCREPPWTVFSLA
jgi:hypothetical protein